MKIAVFLNEDGKAASFNESGVVKVFFKDAGDWKVIRQIPFGISEAEKPNEISQKIRTMAEALDDCRIFAAVEVKGILYTILEGMKFDIWKVEGTPETILNYISDKEEQEKISELQSETLELPTPKEKEQTGYYYINLREIIEGSQRITSKQVLLPFIQNTSFIELEIDCSHIPHWFEKEFPRYDLEAESAALADGFKVKVYHKQ